jgi:hypothetical protein
MDAIAPAIQAALKLFETSFAEVRFADIDCSTLARAAAAVEEVAAAVVAAQASLDSVRRALEERQDELLDQVHRAMAYARVYADNDRALTEALGAIGLPRSPRRTRPGEGVAATGGAIALSTPRPRGRPRKAVSEPMRILGVPVGE